MGSIARRVSSVVAYAALACGCGRDDAHRLVVPPVAASAAPPVDAGRPPVMRPTGPLARGDVSVSFLTETGAYWGPFVQPATDPADAVRPCYKRAIDEDPRVTGWIRVRIAATQGPASFEADLVDSSELPTPLTSCVVAAIRSLGGNGQWLPPRIAYVSLR